MQKKTVDEDLIEFTDQLQSIEADINKKADEMVKLIDQHKTQLLEELREIRSTHEKQAASLRRTISDRAKHLKEMRRDLTNLNNTASLGDIGRQMAAMNDSAADLLNLDFIQTAVTELSYNSVTFCESELKGNIVGKVTCREGPSTAKGSFFLLKIFERVLRYEVVDM